MYEFQIKKLKKAMLGSNDWFTQEDVEIGQLFRLFPDDVWHGVENMPNLFYVLERKSGKKVGYFRPVGHIVKPIDEYGREQVVPDLASAGRGDILRGELKIESQFGEGRYYKTDWGVLLPYAENDGFQILTQYYRGFRW